MTVPGDERQRLGLLVTLIALHSIAVGIVLLFASDLALRLGGWPAGQDLFFVRQGGLFHLIVAAIYLIDYRGRRSVLSLVVAKSCAVIFLITQGGSALVMFSAVVDALMLVSVLWLRARIDPGAGAAPP